MEQADSIITKAIEIVDAGTELTEEQLSELLDIDADENPDARQRRQPRFIEI